MLCRVAFTLPKNPIATRDLLCITKPARLVIQAQGNLLGQEQEMATKQQVSKALEQIGASLHQQPGRHHYDDFEISAPQGYVWAGNLCEVYCYEYDSDMMTKSEFWDEVLIDIAHGLIDESEVG